MASFQSVAERYLGYLLPGVGATIAITVLGFIPGTVIGLLVALARRGRSKTLAALAGIYVDLVRGTPLLVQIMFVFYGLPVVLHYTPDVWTNAAGVLAFNSGAYISEIFRAAIGSVARGQGEAARSLGLSGSDALRYVVLPQAFRVAIPPLGNEFVALLKDSSLLYAGGFIELMTRGSLAAGRSFRPDVIWPTVAIIYLIFTIPAMYGVRRLEGRFSAGDRRA